MVVWIGNEEETSLAKQRFWPALQQLIERRDLYYSAAIGMTRLATIYYYAAMGAVDEAFSPRQGLPSRIHITKLDDSLRKIHCGAGLFLETERTALQEIQPIISAKDQTMTVFGFSQKELESLAWSLMNRGIDRIVPVGKALNFSIIWDGYDLLRSFSKEIEIS